MSKRLSLPTLVLVVVLAGCGAALAKPAKPHLLHFKGKTKEGDKISFVLDGHWIGQFQTILPETCISAQAGNPRVDRFVWSIPYKYWVGYTSKVKYGSPTTYYTITTHMKGNRITGKVSANYSLLGLDDSSNWTIWHCLATANFNLVGH